jgi:transcriptional regulator with GAF, ATPase, and Fis domain
VTIEYPRGLIREVADLVQTLQLRQHLDVDAALAELTGSALRAMPGADYAGITLVSHRDKVRSAAATHHYASVLDDIQQRHEQGPCLSAAWEQHIIRIDDLYAEDRWPHYRNDALRETPIRSAICFQLFADHKHTGALNFYADPPHAFDDDAADIGSVLAGHIAVAWSMIRRDEQFRSALASRDVIGQAKGMLMERFKIDAVQAFELLKRLSQSSNTAVVVVAQQLVDTENYT